MGAAKTITNYSKSGGLKVCRDQTSTKYQLHIIPFTVSVYLQQNVPANLSVHVHVHVSQRCGFRSHCAGAAASGAIV